MATFAIDPAHTDVLFSAKHMMVTNVRGTFTDVTGSIDLDETDPSRSSAEITSRPPASTRASAPVTRTFDPTTSSRSRPIPRSASSRPVSGRKVAASMS